MNRTAYVFEVPRKADFQGGLNIGQTRGLLPILQKKRKLNYLIFFWCKHLALGMEGSYRNRQMHHRKKGRYIEGFNGEGSWTQFLERNPRLSLCTTDLLSRVRKNAVTASNMKNYFALLDNFAQDTA